ncbi:MAG: hypothetical protein F4X77_09605 [Acidobacteriia bacterium]|nr:hypothetical protein [Acidimicrobiaceae bacterium]MYB52436.1 hypothetical protein [Terriglobia bacterium]
MAMTVRLAAIWTEASMQRADIGTVVAQTKTTRTLGMTTAQLVVAVSLAEIDHARSLAATVVARGLDDWVNDPLTASKWIKSDHGAWQDFKRITDSAGRCLARLLEAASDGGHLGVLDSTPHARADRRSLPRRKADAAALTWHRERPLADWFNARLRPSDEDAAAATLASRTDAPPGGWRSHFLA